MHDHFRDNTTVGSVAVKNIAIFISLGLVAIFLLACGGSGGSGDDGDSETPIFPPVVFMADKNTDGTIELYASSDDGATIIKLSETMVSGGDVVDFNVSPNGVWVAYVADQDQNNLFELYVVPVDKTADDDAVKISGDPMAGDGVKEKADGRYAFEWAHDTSRVAYLADQTTAGVIELYSNTPDGNSQTTIRLSVLPDPDRIDRDVEDFAWSPDLDNYRLIAYRADQQTIDVIELWTTSPTSTASQKVSNGLQPGRNLTAFKWAPDAQRIAFIADKILVGEFKLYTTIPNITDDILVSELVDTRAVINFKWSPNSFRLAFIVKLITNDIELLTTRGTIPSVISISNAIKDDDIANYDWSADSSLIAFIADEDFDDVFELYTSDPLASAPTTKVSGTLATGGDVTSFKWAPAELLIAYTADQLLNNKIELFTTNPPPAITIIKVSGGLLPGVVVNRDFEWSPDSSMIAYRANQDDPNKVELYSTDPAGTENNKVSGTLPSGGDVDEFKWNDDEPEPSIGYLANQISVSVIELFASLADGSENTRLSSDLVDENGDPEADADVSAFEWVPIEI